MSTRRVVVGVLLCVGACARSPAEPMRPTEPNAEPVRPVAVDPADPASPASPASPEQPMTPNLILTSHEQRVPLAVGSPLSLRYDGLAVESIAASPDGSYPGGSGVTLSLYFEGGPAPVRRGVSLLSPGYSSRAAAWYEDYRVTLIDVKDPYARPPRIELRVERVTEEVLAQGARTTRVARGEAIELDADTRVEFLGNSTKEIGPGERPPLMVAVRYEVTGEAPATAEFNVGRDGSPQKWDWRAWRFTVVKYAYDEWMEVKVERLRLAPAPQPAG